MPENATMALISSYIISMNSFFHDLSGWGYAGIFLISLIGNASVILPIPSMIFVFLMAKEFNPLLLAIFAGLGSAIGEMTGYGIGLGGASITEKKKAEFKKKLESIEKLFIRYGGFWVIVIFAATPLPFDIVGLASGVLRYSPKKFFIATFIGKLMLNLVIAFAGLYSLTWVIQTLGIQ